MSDCCSGTCASETPSADPRYRRILWIALVINAAMFGVEIIGGLNADSVALLADAVDFFGDATNYGVSLFVLSMAPIWRSRTALIKGWTMGGYGLFVLVQAGWHASTGTLPTASTMGMIGFVALLANGTVALLLYAYRSGDANMRSVWLCSRNDAISNIAVMLAALGVFGTRSGWPDIAVAVVMGGLATSSAISVIRHSRQELHASRTASGQA
jgi:Co/Zn/Cd efflux system component